MIHEYNIRVLPEVAANEQRLKTYLVHEKGLDERTLNAIRILGADEVRRLAGRHTQAALEALGALPGGAPTLRAFAQSLLTRLV